MPKQDRGKVGPNLREPHGNLSPLRSPVFLTWLNGWKAEGAEKKPRKTAAGEIALNGA